MQELYSMEQRILERRRETERESFRRSLRRQLRDHNEPARGAAERLSLRAQAGLLLVRLGQQLSRAALPQQQIGTRGCGCVTLEN